MAEREAAATGVYAALKAAGTLPADAVDLEQRLLRHFRRLPSRYAADVESAEDVVTHILLLDAVNEASGRAAVAVRAVNFTPAPLLPLEAAAAASSSAAADEARRASGSPPVQRGPPAPAKRPPTFGSSLNLLALEDAASPRGVAPPAAGALVQQASIVAHEVAVAARNRPRLLSALSLVLGELGALHGNFGLHLIPSRTEHQRGTRILH